MPRYCVIGAGPAGLASVKTLLDAGMDFDCFERRDAVGGHWNTDYDMLHLITSRNVTGYDGFPMPAHYPLFPSRAQMLEYINLYADAFGLRKHVTFGAGVDAVVPVPAEGPTGSAGWEVAVADGRVRRYDGVFVASGHLWDPKVPAFPGAYSGHQVHSGSYRNPRESVQGERVLVVGSGNSGCDIAVDNAQNYKQVDIVVRRGHYFQPKTFFGKPRAELPFMKEFTFDEQDLLSRLLIRIAVGTWEDYPGLPEPDHHMLKDGPPVVNELLLYWIRHGRIKVRPGIERLDGTTVHFTDGTRGEYDTIAWATGFHASLPFLDPGLLELQDGVPLRVAAAVLPLNLEKLYLIGLIAPRGAQPPVYPIQAELAVAMARLHAADPRGWTRVCGRFMETDEREWRIDILRPTWLEQVERTRGRLLQMALEAREREAQRAR